MRQESKTFEEKKQYLLTVMNKLFKKQSQGKF